MTQQIINLKFKGYLEKLPQDITNESLIGLPVYMTDCNYPKFINRGYNDFSEYICTNDNFIKGNIFVHFKDKPFSLMYIYIARDEYRLTV